MPKMGAQCCSSSSARPADGMASVCYNVASALSCVTHIASAQALKGLICLFLR